MSNNLKPDEGQIDKTSLNRSESGKAFELIFKFLNWILLAGVMITSAWFMRDVWEKFQSNKTSFTMYREYRTAMPTTVMCFQPFIKATILAKYNLSIAQLVYLDFPNSMMNESWLDFNYKASYIIGRDFIIKYDGVILDVGDTNTTPNQTIVVEKLQTIWSGLCYKITIKNITFNKPNFNLVFNQSIVSHQDIPLPEIYVTSEDNAYGIIAYGWNNGEELQFSLDGYDQDFKLHATQHKLLNATSTCSKYLYDTCEADIITKA